MEEHSNITDKDLKEYIQNGGHIFNVVSMDIQRSSRIVVIKAANTQYFADKEGKCFYYDSNLANKIEDESFVLYLRSRISSYIKRLEEDLMMLDIFK